MRKTSENSGNYIDAVKLPASDIKQISDWKETKCTILFPFPEKTVRKRLESAFSLPLDISEGTIFSITHCHGRLNGNTLFIEYVRYAKGALRYDTTGKIFGDTSNGTRLELSIRERNLERSCILSILIGLGLPILIGSLTGVSFLTAWLLILLGGNFLAIILTGINLAVDLGKRRYLMEEICTFLQKAVFRE